MLGSIDFTNILRQVASSLQTPVIVMLLILICITVIALGSMVAELFTERLYLRRKVPYLPDMIDELHCSPLSIRECIEESNLLKRQKNILIEITMHPEITDLERESMAARLVTQEQARYDRRVKLTDIIAKVGPMLGLMGTLIPLGPGVIALGQGDTFTLSNSLLVAFDTTIAGLICAMAALIISTVRKSWYRNDMSVLETLMECILDEEVQYD